MSPVRAGGVDSGVLTPILLLVEPGNGPQAFATAARQVPGVRMAVVAPPRTDRPVTDHAAV